jgi:hypothetical protein
MCAYVHFVGDGAGEMTAIASFCGLTKPGFSAEFKHRAQPHRAIFPPGFQALLSAVGVYFRFDWNAILCVKRIFSMRWYHFFALVDD